ncbi:hypothetical protein TNCV_2145431 [Trichonephila clavipes]|uniref:HTH_48 domain-containing protein n=1 Tax=Trichonephila clavipes TaxID=2585209 RepID=A0A8X6VSI8_TRICX|nr:hypothetical protein TNCV_2145431 [Trichonephila clavipes]
MTGGRVAVLTRHRWRFKPQVGQGRHSLSFLQWVNKMSAKLAWEINNVGFSQTNNLTGTSASLELAFEFYAFRLRFAGSINFLLSSEEKCCRIASHACRSIRWQYSEPCYRWFEKFQNDDLDVRNEERGKPAKKIEDAKLQALLDGDDGQTSKNILQNN